MRCCRLIGFARREINVAGEKIMNVTRAFDAQKIQEQKNQDMFGKIRT